MGFKFIGGPYDGREIPPDEFNRLPRSSRLAFQGPVIGVRTVAKLPPPNELDSVIETGRQDFTPCYYEVLSGGGDFWLRAISRQEADRIQGASELKVDGRARMAVDSLSPEDRDSMIEACAALQNTPPEKWPSEQVVRLAGDKPLYFLRFTPSLRAFVRLLEAKQPRNLLLIDDIVRKETLELFQKQPKPSAVG